MASGKTHKQSKGQIVVLIVIAVVMGIGYVALDRYTESQKRMLTVETRALNMVRGLTKYRQAAGALPDSLGRLVPTYVPAVSQCPDASPMSYQPAGTEYSLACNGITISGGAYSYDSRTQMWSQ